MHLVRKARYGALAGVVVAGLAAGAMSFAATQGSGKAAMGRWGHVPNAPATANEPEASTASPPAGATTITVIDQGSQGQSHFVDVPPRNRFNAGDYVVFEDPLKSADGTQTVGSLVGSCTFAFTRALCTATAHLNGQGKITVSGTVPPQTGPFLLPITGGTTQYSTARGQMLYTPLGHGNATLKFFLQP